MLFVCSLLGRTYAIVSTDVTEQLSVAGDSITNMTDSTKNTNSSGVSPIVPTFVAAQETDTSTDTSVVSQGSERSNGQMGREITPRKRRNLTEEIYFKPDPRRATWYALVCPGLGQIYNRSYWKLPIVYGGMLTLSYFIGWNGRMYNEYHNAYKDVIDNDPNTKSYEALVPNYMGTTSWLQTTMKQKMQRYRRYRDICTFGLVAVYLVSVIDAFVDAHLYDFTVTDDLSMRLEPMINLNGLGNPTDSPQQTASVGVQCSFTFK